MIISLMKCVRIEMQKSILESIMAFRGVIHMDYMISRHIFRLIYNSIVFTMRYSSFLGIILALFSIHSCKLIAAD